MRDRVDISRQIAELCAKLGFPDKKVVAEITIRPAEVTVRYFRLNEHGHKFVESDGNAATAWRTFLVRT